MQNIRFINNSSQGGTSSVHDQIRGKFAGYFNPKNKYCI